MEVLKIAANGTETIPQTVNMKARINNTTDTNNEEKSLKDALTDPMETVGRSQVNFRSGIKHLNNEDLNKLAVLVKRQNIPSKDIPTLKAALIKTLNQYNCKNFEQVTKKIGNDEELAFDFIVNVINEAKMADSKINTDRVSNFATAIF